MTVVEKTHYLCDKISLYLKDAKFFSLRFSLSVCFLLPTCRKDAGRMKKQELCSLWFFRRETNSRFRCRIVAIVAIYRTQRDSERYCEESYLFRSNRILSPTTNLWGEESIPATCSCQPVYAINDNGIKQVLCQQHLVNYCYRKVCEVSYKVGMVLLICS